jgi:hypothetical protein
MALYYTDNSVGTLVSSRCRAAPRSRTGIALIPVSYFLNLRVAILATCQLTLLSAANADCCSSAFSKDASTHFSCPRRCHSFLFVGPIGSRSVCSTVSGHGTQRLTEQRSLVQSPGDEHKCRNRCTGIALIPASYFLNLRVAILATCQLTLLNAANADCCSSAFSKDASTHFSCLRRCHSFLFVGPIGSRSVCSTVSGHGTQSLTEQRSLVQSPGDEHKCRNRFVCS